MFNDIIDGNDKICLNCWWSAKRNNPNNPVSPPGKSYCTLNKKDYDDYYTCESWRHKSLRTKETPRIKINIKWVCPNCGAGYNHKVKHCVACFAPNT